LPKKTRYGLATTSLLFGGKVGQSVFGRRRSPRTDRFAVRSLKVFIPKCQMRKMPHSAADYLVSGGVLLTVVGSGSNPPAPAQFDQLYGAKIGHKNIFTFSKNLTWGTNKKKKIETGTIVKKKREQLEKDNY